MRKLSLFVALLAAAISASAQTPAKPTGQSTDAEQTVKALTREWLDAEGRVDRKTLQRIIADDFMGTGPRGDIVSKEDVIPLEGSEAGGLSVTGQSIQARIFSDTAVVTGHGIPKASGSPELRFTVVFVKRAEGWQMVAAHLSSTSKQ